MLLQKGIQSRDLSSRFPVAGAAVQRILIGERDKNLHLFDDDSRWVEKSIVLTDFQGRFAFEVDATEKFGVYVEADGFAQQPMVNLDYPKDAAKIMEIKLPSLQVIF